MAYAVMPYADYEDACDAVREKTGGTEVIKSGDLGAQIRAIESSASVDTCTIRIVNESESLGFQILNIAYTILDDEGNVSCMCISYGVDYNSSSEIIIENVVCGSFLIIEHNGGSTWYTYDPTNMESFISFGFFGAPDSFFRAPTEAGVTGTIRWYDDD